MEQSYFDNKRIRFGKTKVDRANGNQAKCEGNKRARDAWRNSRDAMGFHSIPFPTHTCNGHNYYRGGSDTFERRKEMLAKVKH